MRIKTDMKEKKLYTCEICHTDYASKSYAEFCEKSHKTTKGASITEVYKPVTMCKDGYPIKIFFTFADGTTIMYKR